MLGRLNHVALAVPDLAAASAAYRDTLGAKVSAPQALPEHGVTVVFVDVGNTKIELLEPLGEGSPIAAFLEKNPSGGMHHVCYEVDDILAARDSLQGQRRARAWRRQPKDRRAWQAGAVPAPQGFLRHAGRTGAGMSWVSFAALFFVTWWVVLFAVLPFSVKTQDDDHDVTLGTVSSAPRGPHMLRAVISTTIVTAVLMGIFYGLTRGLGSASTKFRTSSRKPRRRRHNRPWTTVS